MHVELDDKFRSLQPPINRLPSAVHLSKVLPSTHIQEHTFLVKIALLSQ
jgi:hypothetical protein